MPLSTSSTSTVQNTSSRCNQPTLLCEGTSFGTHELARFSAVTNTNTSLTTSCAPPGWLPGAPPTGEQPGMCALPPVPAIDEQSQVTDVVHGCPTHSSSKLSELNLEAAPSTLQACWPAVLANVHVEAAAITPCTITHNERTGDAHTQRNRSRSPVQGQPRAEPNFAAAIRAAPTCNELATHTHTRRNASTAIFMRSAIFLQ